MRVVIIHGSPRKGNTYEATQKVMAHMRQHGDVEFTEFYLPKDLPEFCRGCFNCFFSGEDKCPHAKYAQPIAQAMDEADGIIFASPVYAMQLSGGMKTLLDHLAYVYMNHRPRYMRKKALVIATTAGAGLGNCLKYIKQNLTLWGVNKVYTLGVQMQAMGWDDMESGRKAKAELRIGRVAKIFYADLASRHLHSPSLVQVVMFNVSKAMNISYDDGSKDKQYWLTQGWLESKCRYHVPEASIGLISGAIGAIAHAAGTRMMRPKK